MGLAGISVLCPLYGSFDWQYRAFDRALLTDDETLQGSFDRRWGLQKLVSSALYTALLIDNRGLLIGLF